ncbi:MAG: sulfite reductase subunit alpha [Rhodobacteraceae bacterium]|nr:sulfite reductase subunit alpha [Paracoccaceae bacterium]
MHMPYIQKDAPFSADQRTWIGGFIAGLHSQKVMTEAKAIAAAEGQAQAKPLDILYGTQTGNAEEVANEAAALAKAKGFTPRVDELDAVDMDRLAGMENLIIVISTYGEGEMPDNAHMFWDALSASTAPRLEELQYGVLALGDTSYEYFCQAGKVIDTRLEQLGARRLGARVDCDVDYEDAATAWLTDVMPEGGPAVANDVVAPAPKKSGWGRKNPYTSDMVENRVLSGAKSAKEIRHLSFALGDSGLTYEAGDALGVMPVNAPDLVEAMLKRLGADHDTAIAGKDAPLGQLLTTGLEIMTPPREFLRGIAPLAKHEELNHVLSHGDKEALEAFLWGKDTLDILNLNPSLEIDPDQFVGWLKPLQHRAYSISSSPKAHEGEVHLTVAAVRWMYDQRQHKGVCSTFLADHVPEGAQAGIFMSPNKAFRVPQDDSVPMVMVGPGTGIAPFRAFLEERRARGASGTNWLFFGDQHRASDFIYEDEISEMSDSGVLTRLDLAFSRDQEEKIYVQHRMAQNGKDLFAALEEGGHFYVCGDATRMAKDVDAALHQVVREHGGRDEEGAVEYVNTLKREKRYVRDVY